MFAIIFIQKILEMEIYMENYIYESNMKALKERYYDIYKALLNKDVENTDVVWDLSASGEEIVAIKKYDRLYYLNSRYSDEEFGNKWIDRFDNKSLMTIYVVFGMANCSYIQKLLEYIKDDSVILLYEPNIQLFEEVIKKKKIDDILSKENLVICVNEINDKDMENFISLGINFINIKHIEYCCMPNYDILYPEVWRDLLNVIKTRFETIIMSKNTELYFAKNFIKNSIYNCKDMVKQYAVGQLNEKIGHIDAISNVPAIVVAAGPSLDKNIEELRNAKGRAMIIAVDTALKPLLKKGIMPDLVITVDAKKPPVLFMHPEFEYIPLVMGDFSNYQLGRIHKGKRFYYAENNSYMNYLYKKETGCIVGVTETGGSVANSAFSFASILGFKTIILVGQDLAFTGRKRHAYDAYGENKKDEFINDGKYFEVEDINGDKVYTEFNMNMYRKWFETQIVRYPYLKVIDATEGGAKIEGTEIISLKQAIDRECKIEMDFESIIDSIERPFSEEVSDKLLEEINNIPEELMRIKKKIEACKRKYQKIEELSRKGKENGSEFKKLVKDISEITEYIESNPLLETASIYEKQVQYKVLSEVYDVKDNIKDEIRDIVKNGINMMDSYMRGIDLFAEDIGKWNDEKVEKLNVNINKLKTCINEIGLYEDADDRAKITECMKSVYDTIVGIINYVDDNISIKWKKCLDKIVRADSDNDIDSMLSIIGTELKELTDEMV